MSNGNWLRVGQSSDLYYTNFKRWRHVHFFQCVDSVMDFPFFALRDDMERIGTLVQNKGNPNPNPNTNPNPNPDLKKGIQIWSAMDGIGSLTDPVEFLRLVRIAEAESQNNHDRQRQVVMITLTLNLTPTLTLTLTLA